MSASGEGQHTPTQGQWSKVDDAGDTAAYAAYLDTVRKFQAANAYKQHTFRMLRAEGGQRVLDAGCGTGDDAVVLARLVGAHGHVTAIDYSQAMVDEAARRWGDRDLPLTFARGDVHDLSFDDDSFDATRSDRVFQHLAEPATALAELARVTRPGGRLTVSDPDWGTWIVDAPDTPALQAYLAHAQRQANNPWIGRQLYGLFRAAGLVDVEVAAHTAFFLDLEVVRKMGNLDAGFLAAVEAGAMTDDQVAEVRAAFEARQAEGRFLASLTIYCAVGTCP